MPRPLKVFATQLGFYDTVVAVPSQAAALKAWGTRMNMFADGTARVADDPQAIEAALANPGVPLKRGVGTGDPFSLNPRLPKLPDLPAVKPGPQKPKPKRPTAEPTPPPPDRSRLDAAERKVAEVDRRWGEQEGSFRERRAALDGEEQRAKAMFEEERREAEAERQDARTLYDQAAGRSGRR